MADFFQKITQWSAYDKDDEQYRFKLNTARWAYQRWRRSVKLVDAANGTATALPIASPKDTATVQGSLGALAVAFKDAEATAGRSQLQRTETTAQCGEDTSSLQAECQAATEKRQKGTKVCNKSCWVVHDTSALEALTGLVSYLKSTQRATADTYRRLRNMFVI